MGPLIVESISCVNFGSHLATSIELGGNGAVAIVGPNGAGKSTLVSKALTWCLYGSTAPERMGSSTKAIRGRDVIRKRETATEKQTPKADSATVTVVLAGDGTHYEVIRTRKLTGSDTVEVRQNGGIVATGQSAVDSLIGVPYDMFVRTVVRGQGDPWNFAEATDKRKREILDTLSGAAVLEEAHKRAVAARKAHEVEIDVHDRHLANLRSILADSNIEAIERDAQQWAATQAHRIAEADAEVASAQAAFASADAWDAEQNQRAAAIEAARAAPDQSVDLSPYHKAVTEASSAASAARAALAAVEAERDRVTRLIQAGKCPTCGQSVHGLASEVPSIGQSRALFDEKEKTRLHAIEVLNQAHEWNQQCAKQKADRIAALPRPAPLRKAAVEASLDAARRRAQALRDAENPYAAALKAVDTRLEKARGAIVRVEELKALEVRDLGLAKAWEASLAPKGVRASLAEATLAAIEMEANRWLSVLSRGTLSVAFPPRRETSTGSVREEIQTIIKRGESERDLLSFSGGEKARINLAVDLGVASAFTRGGSLALSLLVLDEQTFSGMDEEGARAVVEALASTSVADVVVIDHDTRLTGQLPRTIRVSRGPDGYSTVEEES